MRHRTIARLTLRGTAAAAVATLALAGCSGGPNGSGATGELAATTGHAGDAARPPAAAPKPGAGIGVDGATASGATTQSATLLSREVIQRAGLTVHARNVGDAVNETRSIVESVQGVIASEQTETGRRGQPRRSTLTLRVPVDAFGDVLGRLKELGRLGSQQVSVQDVTTEVIDVDARIVSAQRTLKRIRDLLARADSFTEILSLEGELARREADLASLQAQQAYLEDQTSLSTIDLTLLPPLEKPAPEPDSEASGFIGGLAVGWDALVGVVTVALTALGVIAPLLLLLVPVSALLWWGVRRATRRLPRQSTTG